MVFLVHSPVHVSPIFNYRSASNPPSPPHDSSAESVTPKGSPKPRINPPNQVPHVPSDPNSDPSLSGSSFSDSFDSSDNDYSKQIRSTKRVKINSRVKSVSMNLSKSEQSIHPSYLKPCKNQCHKGQIGQGSTTALGLFPIFNEFS